MHLKKGKGQEKCPHSEQFSTFHKNIIKQYDRTEIKHIDHIGLISVVNQKKKKKDKNIKDFHIASKSNIWLSTVPRD